MKGEGKVVNSQCLPPLKVPNIFLPHQPSGTHLSPRLSRVPFIQTKNLPKMPSIRPLPGTISPRPSAVNRSPRHIPGKQYSPTLAPLTENYDVMENPPSELLQTIGKKRDTEEEEEGYESQKICNDSRFLSYVKNGLNQNILTTEEEDEMEGYCDDSYDHSEENENENPARRERRGMRRSSISSSQECE